MPVADRIVLVNGLPGAGKTTLATPLAARLGAPLLSKDALKEAVADALPGAVPPGLGAAVMEFVWQLAARADGLAVVESWWFAPRDRDLIREALSRLGDPAVVELWCDAPAATARQRYAARRRHPVHDDARRLAADWDTWARSAAPLHVGAVLRVPTTAPVDVGATARKVLASFPARSAARR